MKAAVPAHRHCEENSGAGARERMAGMPATQGSLEVLRERLEALRDELADVEQQVGGMRVGETPVSEVNRIEARLPELRRRVHALEATLARESH